MQAIKEATAYRRVTKSSKPLPSALGNCSKVINSGAKKNAELNNRPIQDIRIKVTFGVIFFSCLLACVDFYYKRENYSISKIQF